MDTLTPEKRSWNMSRIRGRDTGPELTVRSMLHRMGYRFRVHNPHIPGRPDICLPKHKTVVFVHGCYWHRHEGCRFAYTPKSRVEFWTKKFTENVARDQRKYEELSALGWKVMVVWECETRSEDALRKKMERELKSTVGYGVLKRRQK